MEHQPGQEQPCPVFAFILDTQPMTDNSSMMDIILLALIAVFIGLRLRSVLGSRPETEQQEGGSVWGKVIDMPRTNQSGVAAILAADPGFDPNFFLQGAKQAFAMIVNAFSVGDMTTLRPLVSDDVFVNFTQALEQQSLEQVRVTQVTDAEILQAGILNEGAEIIVQFTSDQELRGQVTRVKDVWTFRRRLGSPDPSWLLVATRAADA